MRKSCDVWVRVYCGLGSSYYYILKLRWFAFWGTRGRFRILEGGDLVEC